MAVKNTYWRTIRRIGWSFLIISAALLMILLVTGIIMNKPQPQQDPATFDEADRLAAKMVQAVHGNDWDSTNVVSWDFVGRQKHIWDRKRMLAKVEWGKKMVLINLSTKQGKAFVKGKEVEGAKKDKLLNKAWSMWVNDSFWLNPVVKVFDEGVTRSIVPLKNGKKGLMAQYSSGGLTPGDAYVWELDEQYRPISWQLWVKVVPVGGLSFSWEGWQQTSTGAWISSIHEGPFTIKVSDIKTADSIEALVGSDIFSEIIYN
ncbi:MAG: hypothetical protein AB8F95_05455 [Bacteroidia bacterium]